MKGMRQAVTVLCLATTLSVPSLAVSGEICRGDETGKSAPVQPQPKLNLAAMKAMSGWSAEAMASSPADSQTINAQAADAVQTQTTEKKKWSTAKKTWVIVGSVVGAALIIAAVSNSGGGSSGGGGY